MTLFVLSDSHIWGPEDPLYQSLLNLLQQRAMPGDSVVLAGDLFDLFVGNKEIFKTRYSGFIDALSEAGARGIRLYYIEGNHDFLIRNAFKGIKGLSVHTKHFSATLAGKKFYFAHGDTVDKADFRYRALRAFFRSPIMKALVYLVPGEWLDQFGKASSSISRKSRRNLPTDLPVHKMEYLRRTFRSYAAEQLARGHDYVVMGHCHDLDEMSFNIGGRQGQYVNVGFPRMHGSLLSWAPGDEKIRREKLP